MKILLVTHNFPRTPDDMAGAFLLALARGQRALGHEVTVVAPHAPGAAEDEVMDGIRVRRYRYGSDDAETLAYAGTMHEQVLRSWAARWRLVRFLVAARRAVTAAIREERPDVVHVHWWFPGGFAVWPRRAAPATVLTSHGTDLFLLDRFSAARFVAGPFFRRADQVTVISSPLVPRAARLGVAAERITVVPMPVDESAMTAAPGADLAARGREVLFVGRLIERKGAAVALRAFALLQQRGVAARLTIVGDGPQRAELEQLATALGIADRVQFTGRVPSGDVAALQRRAAVFVMPAVTDWKGEQEGFGMVLVEAMAAGTPVVASRSGGIVDVVVEGESGVLVAENDAPALADAVARLLADRALAARLAAAAAARLRERFSPEAIARTFDGVYRRAVEAHR